MEQRRLRLGDILDDYCPRERRVTNHAVVALVEEDVKQTRCTTCDAEHVYKGGQTPRRKKAETTGKLYKQVLAGLTDDPAVPSSPAPQIIDAAQLEPEPIEVMSDIVDETPAADDLAADDLAADDGDESSEALLEDGPVHRPLIRAQLPRVEGAKVERQAPDFTIRQNAGRTGGFRGAQGNGNGHGNGQRFGRGPNRGGGRGGGMHYGFGRGPGGNPQRQGGGGPRKRGR
jgi:hypothetical protein